MGRQNQGRLADRQVLMSKLDWNTPPKPVRAPLAGRYMRIEPLDPARHGHDLWSELHSASDVWTFMAYGPFPTRQSFDAFLEARARDDEALYFALIDGKNGRACGWLALMAIRPEHGVVEIGNIVFGPSVQRTRLTTEAVAVASNHVFELGYRRLEWKCDAANARSRAAALRFGFRYEGLFHQHMVVKGHNRDTAWYALLDSDWPMRRAQIEAWLDPANFDDNGGQIIPLVRNGQIGD